MKLLHTLTASLAVMAFVIAGTPQARGEEDHDHEHHDNHGHHASESHGDDFWHDDHEEADHGHIGEHGGQFGDASDVFHFEVLLDDNKDVVVYLYDDKAMPIADITQVETRWTLNPGTENEQTGMFESSEGNEYLLLDLPPDIGDEVSIKVEAKKDGRWWPVEFLLSRVES